MNAGQWNTLLQLACTSDDTPPDWTDAAEAAVEEIQRLQRYEAAMESMAGQLLPTNATAEQRKAEGAKMVEQILRGEES